MTIQTLVWLFIVIFVIHDLEEIIYVESWIKKHRSAVLKKTPARISVKLDKMFNITSAQFAVAKKYTPGVLSAILIVLPYTIYLFHTLLSESLVTWSEILYSIPVGLLLIPIVLLGHELGRKIVR